MLHEVHSKGGIDFKTLNDETLLSPGVRYGRSKPANVLFAKALTRRLKEEHVYVNVAHPGLVATELNRSNEAAFGKFGSRFLEALNKIFVVKPEVGALTQLYCATSPKIEERDCRGKYFIPIAHDLDPSKLPPSHTPFYSPPCEILMLEIQILIICFRT